MKEKRNLSLLYANTFPKELITPWTHMSTAMLTGGIYQEPEAKDLSGQTYL